MHQQDIIHKINTLLIEEIEVDESLISPQANLKKDLGIDSLDFVDLFVIIDNHFGIKLKAEEMSEVVTLGDFYEHILKRLDSNPN